MLLFGEPVLVRYRNEPKFIHSVLIGYWTGDQIAHVIRVPPILIDMKKSLDLIDF